MAQPTGGHGPPGQPGGSPCAVKRQLHGALLPLTSLRENPRQSVDAKTGLLLVRNQISCPKAAMKTVAILKNDTYRKTVLKQQEDIIPPRKKRTTDSKGNVFILIFQEKQKSKWNRVWRRVQLLPVHLWSRTWAGVRVQPHSSAFLTGHQLTLCSSRLLPLSTATRVDSRSPSFPSV